MVEIKILKYSTPKSLTETYNKLSDFKGKPITLLIPIDLSHYRFGLLADILKLVITLNRICDIRIVKLDFDSSKLDKFYEQSNLGELSGLRKNDLFS